MRCSRERNVFSQRLSLPRVAAIRRLTEGSVVGSRFVIHAVFYNLGEPTIDHPEGLGFRGRKRYTWVPRSSQRLLRLGGQSRDNSAGMPEC